ncbi:basic salivary proline-rich protein 3-like [Hippopotamus amphibius kiboko]|uniref:basic salivary proline-rich protein 3-like n=1 Tax=Hippopotamus amphibius kiboko TaxID=575201 RepID=UPI0025960EFC|nr:basic salivary proline-rich protein 3-like [Hippopotamus amphibius kiboko]
MDTALAGGHWGPRAAPCLSGRPGSPHPPPPTLPTSEPPHAGVGGRDDGGGSCREPPSKASPTASGSPRWDVFCGPWRRPQLCQPREAAAEEMGPPGHHPPPGHEFTSSAPRAGSPDGGIGAKAAPEGGTPISPPPGNQCVRPPAGRFQPLEGDTQVYGEHMSTGDRCPRKHLSRRLGPPASSGPVHRHRLAGPPNPPPREQEGWSAPRGSFRQPPGRPGSFHTLSQRGHGVFGLRKPSGARAPEQAPASPGKGVSGPGRHPRRKGRVSKSQAAGASQGQCAKPHTPSGDTSPRTGVAHPVAPLRATPAHQFHLCVAATPPPPPFLRLEGVESRKQPCGDPSTGRTLSSLPSQTEAGNTSTPCAELIIVTQNVCSKVATLYLVPCPQPPPTPTGWSQHLAQDSSLDPPPSSLGGTGRKSEAELLLNDQRPAEAEAAAP